MKELNNFNLNYPKYLLLKAKYIYKHKANINNLTIL